MAKMMDEERRDRGVKRMNGEDEGEADESFSGEPWCSFGADD